MVNLAINQGGCEPDSDFYGLAPAGFRDNGGTFTFSLPG